MTLARRALLRLIAGTAALPAAARISWAQSYPTRPVRFVVGFAPGGGGDIATRLMGQWLSDRLGQQFVVENRVGAASNLATEQVVRAPADGYTLIQLNVANAINASLYKNLSFNVLRDLAPVASFMRVPNVMEVSPTVPINTVPEFIAEGQSGKADVCVLGRRHDHSHVRRIIQGDGRRRHAARALSRARGWRLRRSHDRRSACDLRQPARLHRIDTRRQAARARGHLRDALAGDAGASNRGGCPAGLRGKRMVRHRRARRHTRRYRRAAQ